LINVENNKRENAAAAAKQARHNEICEERKVEPEEYPELLRNHPRPDDI